MPPRKGGRGVWCWLGMSSTTCRNLGSPSILLVWWPPHLPHLLLWSCPVCIYCRALSEFALDDIGLAKPSASSCPFQDELRRPKYALMAETTYFLGHYPLVPWDMNHYRWGGSCTQLQSLWAKFMYTGYVYVHTQMLYLFIFVHNPTQLYM